MNGFLPEPIIGYRANHGILLRFLFRRIQNELTSCVAECRQAKNELEIAKRQIEDLKTQLQHYVAEVKRTEDLISQKVSNYRNFTH